MAEVVATYDYTLISSGAAYSVTCNNKEACTRAEIPNTYSDLPVTSIGYEAFYGCSKLTSVEIPNSITSISEAAFSDCSSLTSIVIPDSVTSIGEYAFESCSSLTSVTIPDRVTSIGDYAFWYCSSLTNVTIGNRVTSIGYHAFEGCSGLTNVTIPDRVTSIGEGAFVGCSNLESITIGKGVTSIGEYAFSNCSSLESITVDSGNTKYHSKDNCLIETATNTLILGCKNSFIPNYVTSISEYAFYGCSGITSIAIPNSVTSIGEEAFYDCSSLETMIVCSTTPPTIASGAISTATTKIVVPKESETAYKTALNWSAYSSLIVSKDNNYFNFLNYTSQLRSRTKTIGRQSIWGSGDIEIERGEVDQNYNPLSPNAQSGIAVAQAVPTAEEKENWNNKQSAIDTDNPLDVQYISGLADVATSGSYSDLIDLPTIPTVNNSRIIIKQGDVTKGSFTLNQGTDTTITLGGYLTDDTKYGASLELSIDEDYTLTAQLKDQDGDDLGDAQSVSLPLESVVVSGSYDSVNKTVTLTLQNGNEITFGVADLVSGLVTEEAFNSHKNNKANPHNVTKAQLGLGNVGNFKAVSTEAGQDLLESEKSNARANIGAGTSSFSGNYTDLDNKPTIPTALSQLSTDVNNQRVSSSEKAAWNNKQDKIDSTHKLSISLIDGLATVATSGDYNDLDNIPTIPTALSQLSEDITHRTVTDAEKGEWNSKQEALTLTQQNAVNSGITSGKVAAYDSYDSTKLNINPNGTDNLLDSNNKINTIYIPTSILGQVKYKGTWDANSSTPVTTSPQDGDYYICKTAGNRLPTGEISSEFNFNVGDWAIYGEGEGWSRVPNVDAVTMVNGQVGSIRTFKGAWTAGTQYYAGDFVVDGSGVAYLCKANNTGVALTDTTKWHSFAIPTQLSELTDDSEHRTVTDDDIAEWNGKQDKIDNTHKLSSDLISDLAEVATSGDYNDLDNKPTIPTVNNGTLTIQKNGLTVGTFEANQSGDTTANIEVPTELSDLSDDSTHRTVTDDEITSWNNKQAAIDSTNKLPSNLVSGLAEVATSGSYNDLINKPTIINKYIVNTTYNPTLATNSDEVTVTSLKDTSNIDIPLSSLHVGDLIYLTENTYPKRWVKTVSSSSATLSSFAPVFSAPLTGVKSAGSTTNWTISNGIATAPIATSTEPGVVEVDSNNGIGLNPSSQLMLIKATNNEIDAKTNSYKVIVPANQDYAFKKSFTNNGETWSESDKAAARELIDASNVPTLTLSSSSIITQDPLEVSLDPSQLAILDNEDTSHVIVDASALGIGKLDFFRYRYESGVSAVFYSIPETENHYNEESMNIYSIYADIVEEKALCSLYQGIGAQNKAISRYFNSVPSAPDDWSPSFIQVDGELYFKGEKDWDEPIQTGDSLLLRQAYSASIDDDTLTII